MAEDNFLDNINPMYRSHMEGVSSLDDLAKSYVDLRDNAKNALVIPTNEASDEVMLDFNSKLNNIGYVHSGDTESIYNALGRPKSAEDYTIPTEGNEDFLNYYKEFRNKAHEIGISADQMAAMIEYDKSQIKRVQDNIHFAAEKATDTLKKMYGGDLDNRAKGANITLQRLSELDKDNADQIGSYAKTNPLVFKLLADAYEATAETGSKTPVGEVKYGLTPDEADAAIHEMLENPRSGVAS